MRAFDSNVAFNNCSLACTGELAGAKYSIKLPSKWNGTLLLYSHGYRFALPGSPGGPIDTSAQVSSTDPDGTGSDPLSKRLLALGYALAGSSDRSNGWAVTDGVSAGVALYKRFVVLVAKPQRTYVWGDSLGGLISEIIAEQNPSFVDGAAPMCAALAGPNLDFDLALDVAFAVKALLDPALKITGYASAAEALAEWRLAVQKVGAAATNTTSGGTAKLLFIADLVDAPHKTATYDGHDLASQVKATVAALQTALAFGILGRYDVEHRVGGNPSDNTKTNYAARISEADTTVISAAGGDVANFEAALGVLPRVSADPAARTKFDKLGDAVGELTVPTLTMHTEDDPLVLVANETVFAQRVQARAENGRLAQLYIAPPASYSQSTGAPYGAGQCNFSDRQREALISTLDSWVRTGVYPVSVGVASRFGPGLDATFLAPAWPSSAA